MASQTLVGGVGLGLVAANYWTSSHKTVSAGLFNPNAGASAEQAAHTELFKLGLELLVVGALTLIAGTSPAAATGALAIVVALAIVWAIKHYSQQGAATK